MGAHVHAPTSDRRVSSPAFPSVGPQARLSNAAAIELDVLCRGGLARLATLHWFQLASWQAVTQLDHILPQAEVQPGPSAEAQDEGIHKPVAV